MGCCTHTLTPRISSRMPWPFHCCAACSSSVHTPTIYTTPWRVWHVNSISVKLWVLFNFINNYFIKISYANTQQNNAGNISITFLWLFYPQSQNTFDIKHCLSSPEERPLCQTAFELVAFEGPRWATYAGYEIHCCRADCATTHGHRYKTCFLRKIKIYLHFRTTKYTFLCCSSSKYIQSKQNRARKR